MKNLLYIVLLIMFQIHNVAAKEYNTVEDILNDKFFTIDKLGYSSRSKDCQSIINNWVEKFTSYIDNNPADARALFYRGIFYGFKPGCWRSIDPVIKSLDRKTYLESQFLKDNIKKMNADWGASLTANENTFDKTKRLSWFVLDGMFSGYIQPEIVEKKEKLRIKIATPLNLGAGTEHPMDKNTFILKQYEKIADKYNYVDDRKNVTRILNELAQISPEGRVKANKLTPMYEKAWQQRDNKIALQQDGATKDTTQTVKPAQPKSKIPAIQSKLVQTPKSATPKIEPAPENIDYRLWYVALGILILLVVGIALIRSRRQ